MRWTAHISILFALAAASASATVPSSAPSPAPVRAPSAQSLAKDGASARKAPKRSSKTYAEGFRKGYAAGRAAARHQARLDCPAPAGPHAPASPAVADEPDPGLHPSRAVQHAVPNAPSSLIPIPKNGPLPAPLRGSYSSLERQNTRLEKEGLERIEDQHDLEARIANKMLVPLPASEGLVINAKLPANRRYCRPWTAHFLSDLALAHEAAFQQPLEVNSAVRTVAYQKRLRRANVNAAPAKGEVVSPHLTGAAVDIAKEQLPRAEISWLRRELLALQKAGKIDVEEEFQQACFHVTVYKSYDEPRQRLKPAVPTHPAAAHRPAPAAAHAHPPTPSAKPAARPAKKNPPASQPTEVIVSGQ